NRTRWLDAAAEWSRYVQVSFVQRTSEANYVVVHDATANNSLVGMQGGAQDLNIVTWSSKFIIAHEIGHALGQIHEHQRPDRDSRVQINPGNIISGYENQFDIRTGATTYGSYDFESVMHYDQCAFASNCQSGANPTITVLPPYDTYWQDRIGQRDSLSQR